MEKVGLFEITSHSMYMFVSLPISASQPDGRFFIKVYINVTSFESISLSIFFSVTYNH